MRQAGVLAAAGLVSLEKMTARLPEDHDNARVMADLLSRIPVLDVEAKKVRTNILMVGVTRTGKTSDQIAAVLREEGVWVSLLDSARIRLVTHNDVSRDQIIRAAEIFKRVLGANA